MKKSAFTLLALLLVACSMFAQTTQNRNCTDFDGIKISGPFKIILSEAPVTSVKVVADESYQSKIVTEVKKGVLEIYIQDSNFNTDLSDLTVYVATKSLNFIKAGGASKVESTTTLNANKLILAVSGASILTLDLKANDLKINASGASNIKLKGAASHIDAELSGASSLKAYNLSAHKVDVVASGASVAKVNASEAINIKASGASEVSYTGTNSGKVIEQSGASRVNYKNSVAEE